MNVLYIINYQDLEYKLKIYFILTKKEFFSEKYTKKIIFGKYSENLF